MESMTAREKMAAGARESAETRLRLLEKLMFGREKGSMLYDLEAEEIDLRRLGSMCS